MTIRTPLAISALAVAALALAGCSAPAADTTSDAATIQVVASTSVYGDIAQAIGGDLVTVTSIISGPSQDPHSYEASARDQLAISKADLVIENGGGYDPFVDVLLSAANSTARVITAVDDSELLDHNHEAEHTEDHHDADNESSDDATEAPDDAVEESHDHDDDHGHIEGFNEHVWYSIHGMSHVAAEIADELSDLDPSGAATFAANLATLQSELEALETRATELAATLTGGGVAVTEPVALYLLESVGLVNQTPADFTEAIEEGTDVSPVSLQQTLDLFTDGSVVLLGYNEQTASPETEKVRSAAEAAGIPVVSFTETLPDGESYVSWMTANLDAIQAALAS